MLSSLWMIIPERSTPQHKMWFVRNAAGNTFVFSDKKMKKIIKRMERKFSKDWRTVTQVVIVRGEEVSCMEGGGGDGVRGSVMLCDAGGGKLLIAVT